MTFYTYFLQNNRLITKSLQLEHERKSADGAARSKSIPNVIQLLKGPGPRPRILFSVLPSNVSQASETSKLKLDALLLRSAVLVEEVVERSSTGEGHVRYRIRCLHEDCPSKKNVMPSKESGKSKKSQSIFIRCDHEREMYSFLLGRRVSDSEDAIHDADFFMAKKRTTGVVGPRTKTFTAPTPEQNETERNREANGGWRAIAEKRHLLAAEPRSCVCPRGSPCACGARCHGCDGKWDFSKPSHTIEVSMYSDVRMFMLQTAVFRCKNPKCECVLRWDGDKERVLVEKNTGT